MNTATIDVAQSSSAEYSHIRENNNMVWALTPGNPSVLDIAVQGIPLSDFIFPSQNTARLGSEDYIVSGYLSSVANRQLGLGDPQTQASIMDNLSLLGKPGRPCWVYVPENDRMPVKWERPKGEAFTQQFSNSLTRLKSTQRLGLDWDGYGAVEPPTSTIARSFILLWSLYEHFINVGESLPEPFVAPVPDGRIQFEWEAGNIEFEVTIDKQGEMEYLLSDSNDEDKFQEGIASTEKELGDILLSNVFKKGINITNEATKC